MQQNFSALLIALSMALAPAASAAGWRTPKPPVPTSIDAASLQVLKEPTLAERHLILDHIADLPESGVTVSLTCSVIKDEDIARLSCDGNPLDRRVVAAKRVAEAYHFSLGGLSPSPEAPIHTRFKVKLIPPRLDLEPVPGELVDVALFTIRNKPTSRDAGQQYPDRAQRLETAGRGIVACKVLPDLSLGCIPSAEDPPGFGFADAAVRLGAAMVVEPALTDGRPAAGKWVKVGFAFRLPR